MDNRDYNCAAFLNGMGFYSDGQGGGFFWYQEKCWKQEFSEACRSLQLKIVAAEKKIRLVLVSGVGLNRFSQHYFRWSVSNV